MQAGLLLVGKCWRRVAVAALKNEKQKERLFSYQLGHKRQVLIHPQWPQLMLNDSVSGGRRLSIVGILQM